MARTEYTTRKRLMMQWAVWVVCIASLGLAAGVAHWKVTRVRVDLAPPRTLAGLQVRLPDGWMTEVGSRGTIRLIRCSEQSRGGGLGRAMLVVLQPAQTASDPLEFLSSSVLDEDEDQADASAAERFSVAGHNAVVLEYAHSTVVGRTVHKEQQTIACVIFDGGIAVVIQYVGHGDPYSKDLVRQVAQSIHMVDDGGDGLPARPGLPLDGAI